MPNTSFSEKLFISKNQWIQLSLYTVDDFPLLEQLNSPEMTRFLGDPESHEKLLDRHRRYLEIGETGRVFSVILYPNEKKIGSICYWDTFHDGLPVYEIGWGILPEYQGRGIATAAVQLAIACAKKEGKHTQLHAFPSVENVPSNNLCRHTGFSFIGKEDFEYPKGNSLRCNHWWMPL